MLQTLRPGTLDADTRPIAVTVEPTLRNRAAVLIVLLALVVGAVLVPFASGLFGAVVLYVLWADAYRRLTRRLPEGVAAAIVIAGVVALIFVPITWLVVSLIDQAPGAVAAVRGSDVFARLGQLHVGNLVVGDELAKASGSIMSWLSAQLFTLAGSAGSAGLNLMIALLGLYFLLRGPDGLWATVREYIPFSRRTADALRDHFVDLTRATVLGTGVVVLAQGILIGLAFALVGLPNAVFWGTVAALTALVPVVGATLVWLPAALLLASQHRHVAAVMMALIGGGIAGNIDQVLRPLFYRRMSNVHPMVTLVGAFAGVRQFGMMGLLLGPLVIAFLFELLRHFRAEYVDHASSA